MMLHDHNGPGRLMQNIVKYVQGPYWKFTLLQDYSKHAPGAVCIRVIMVIEVFCLLAALKPKSNVLLTNSCVTHESNIHGAPKITTHGSKWICFAIGLHWTADSIAGILEHLCVYYSYFDKTSYSFPHLRVSHKSIRFPRPTAHCKKSGVKLTPDWIQYRSNLEWCQFTTIAVLF